MSRLRNNSSKFYKFSSVLIINIIKIIFVDTAS